MPERIQGSVRKLLNFVGSYRHVVDAQGRIQLPKPIRRTLAGDGQKVLIVTRGLDGCLTAYTLREWRQLHERWQRAVSEPEARSERQSIRLITSQAAESAIDAQGRISVPSDLLKSVSIESEVLVVGALDRVELWNPLAFESAMSEVEGDFYQNGDGFVLASELYGELDD